jgi:tetratricopeptide (TPR) repeat protein
VGKKGELDSAISMYREILETARKRDLYGPEGYATTKYFLADFLIQAEQYADAAVELDWILEADITNAYWLIANAYLARGKINLALGDHESAKQDLYAVLDMKNHEDSHKKSRELLRTMN